MRPLRENYFKDIRSSVKAIKTVKNNHLGVTIEVCNALLMGKGTSAIDRVPTTLTDLATIELSGNIPPRVIHSSRVVYADLRSIDKIPKSKLVQWNKNQAYWNMMLELLREAKSEKEFCYISTIWRYGLKPFEIIAINNGSIKPYLAVIMNDQYFKKINKDGTFAKRVTYICGNIKITNDKKELKALFPSVDVENLTKQIKQQLKSASISAFDSIFDKQDEVDPQIPIDLLIK